MCTASCTFILCVMVYWNIDIRGWELHFQIFPCPHHSASLCSVRRFSVRLRRDLGVLHPELVVETSDGTLQYDSSRAYVGHLTGTSSPLLLHVLCSRSEMRNCICISSKGANPKRVSTEVIIEIKQLYSGRIALNTFIASNRRHMVSPLRDH